MEAPGHLVSYKKLLIRLAGILFALGTVALAALIIAILLPL